ncbi:cytochrome P450 [Perilla frutescens var. hirtella]|nr:cytochrome P450 [Perilla frutescens var. hirtella]
MDTAALSVLIVTLLIVVAVLVKWGVKLLNWVWFRPRKLEKFLREQGLNGTRYSPFLGDVRDCISSMTDEQPKTLQLSDDILPHIYRCYMQNLSKCGENSFMWFGPWPLVNICDPEIVKEIMKKSDVIGRPYEVLEKILTAGLATLQGPKWAKHRKIVNPAFHLDKLRNMVPAIYLSCSSYINKLDTMVSRSNEIDMWPYLEDLSSDMISRTAFGSSHDEGRKIFELLKEKLKFITQVIPLAFIPKWRYVPTKANRKIASIIEEIKWRIKGIIEKRQKAMELRGDTEDEAPSDDLLGILLDSNAGFIKEEGNKNCGMSVEDVINECEMFYLAGSETTSSLLMWTMVLLCQHPHWQTRAREEVNRVFGDNPHPTFESLNHLKTLTMILQEMLRLYPPVPIIVRRTKEEVQLGKWTIPAGVYLMVLIGLLHHDPKIWGDDAKEFNPLRFSGGVSAATTSPSSYIPFAAGPHLCIGQNFAMIEAKMAIAMILRRFSFELSPSYSHAPFYFLTIAPQYGATMILRKL